MSSFYNEEELKELGLKKFGENVLISRKCSIYGASNITIGSNVRIDDFCILSGKIEIGDYVHIAAGVFLFAGQYGIVFKDFSGISSRSAIYATNDDYSGKYLTNPTVPSEYTNVTGGTVTLEKHALIGSGCTIMPNVTIGEGSSIGSMSFVNKSIEPFTICVGIPAKPIKDRKKDMLTLEKKLRYK